MGKRQPAFDDRQLAFNLDAFNVPMPERFDGALAHLPRMISSSVARILQEDGRSRHVMAGELSRLLGTEVSKMTIDGWASESRDRFNISAAHWIALLAATDRVDVLDGIVRPALGVAVFEGPEVATAELGHIDRQIAALRDRRKKIEQRAVPIRRAEGSR
ncbi:MULTISPECIES: hypothetical protein [unclassified Sphingopyxis]|uniref:hypothetical protein n=1 Tax=unclassified Sphingopyxis TaxID=2614943 RepID=UPI000730D5D5|nr:MULTISPECIES: hypothetical protein [unclassified Sphingopyxis]KTE24432.1 hypothetical protein ATE61_13580 [Sphingopyxis sp. H057]KTE50960.1 hypothetical protein ATE69_17280 [Sphingopyxis sp. H071]KTE52103.1 hypothetical protein ATE64_11885 [Sphingopyxis sp. H073]KTE60564.1 hypothetical protein ATE66_08260 [Sphingopyxis sp. H107]KTE63847.1 hypothetical protein ATE65_13675 [Sphingopyxis sp. H100]